jgi:glycosyltransferase involved in cell wall biosynthesis
MQIIPYGAAEMFFCGPSRQAPARPVRLLHVGDLNHVKDQETLLRAFQIVTRKIDSRLTIAGRDLLDGRIEKLAGEMGIRDKVRFLGHVHHELLPPLYCDADFLLHTSLYEAQGVVISEACAAGSVVCGTRVGLVADLEGRCAVASAPGDPEGLAEAVIALVEDPVRWGNIRSAARAWAMQHDAAWTAREFSRLYQKLLNF